MKRVPEVIDCWFDSGAMPFAQHHYPFENKEVFEQQFPAQFISEAVDQTRGWFYSLMAISTLLFNKAPFENVIVLGHVQDENGQKMSKSRGNSIMLSATAAETAKLIKKSRTDSERKITFDPINRPEVSALLTTAALTTGRDPKEIAEEIGDSGAGALKMYVVESVNNFLAPMRERRAELAKDMDYVRDVLAEGNKKANAIANETLEQVRDAMERAGIDPMRRGETLSLLEFAQLADAFAEIAAR